MPRRKGSGAARGSVADEIPMVMSELHLNGYIAPHFNLNNPKQIAFLMLNALDVFYGGAGGGGKTYAFVAAALQYVHVPGYSALLIRKTRSSMYMPGGIALVLQEWLTGTDARWDAKRNAWVFPNGASVTLGYLNDRGDLGQFKGAAFDFIGIDEASELAEHLVAFLFSRLRRLKGSVVPPRFRTASNPGGPGHDYLKARYIDPHDVRERVTIRAWMEDNAENLDVEQYNRSLDELARVDPIAARQIRKGDWTARHGGSIFKREWLDRPAGQDPRWLDRCPDELRRVVRYWDLAGTEDLGSNDPDWTAGVSMGDWPGKGSVLIHGLRRRESWHVVKGLIRSTGEGDRGRWSNRYTISWEDVGLAGKMASSDLTKELAGFTFRRDPKTSRDSKMRRALPLSATMEAGNLYVVRGPWVEDLMAELEGYPVSGHDDYVDACSGAYHALTNAPSQGTIDYFREEAEKVLKAAGATR